MRIAMEIKNHLKNNFVLVFFQVIILSIFLVLIYIFLSFTSGIQAKIHEFNDVYKDKELFSLADTLLDPNEFYSFRSSKKSISLIGDFYDELNQTTSFKFLSIFDQQVPVENFKGDISFDYAYGTEMHNIGKYKDEASGKVYQNIKSIQMNKNTFDFYKLEVDLGNTINWENVDYQTRKIPILLGDSYRNIYNIGDVINGIYYNQLFEFKVVGFIKKNSFIFYKGKSEKYLDDYLVIPYPLELSSNDQEDNQFKGILYFAMINGDIVAESKGNTLQYVLEKMDIISQKTSFDKYTILGVNNFVVQHKKMLSIFNVNKNLILVILFLSVLMVTLVFAGISYFVYIRRKMVYYLYFLSGCADNKIFKLMGIDMSLAYIISFLGIAILTLIFNFWIVDFILVLLGITCCIYLIIYFILLNILKTDFSIASGV